VVNLTKAGFRRVSALTVAVALAALLGSPVLAGPDTLKRSVENLTQFPFDLVVSPIVAGQSIYDNMQSIDDTTAVRIAYPIPGFFWNTMVQAGASVLRGVTGVIELLPGIVLAFTDSDMEPLYDPVEDNDALLELDNDYYRVKIGVHYTAGG